MSSSRVHTTRTGAPTVPQDAAALLIARPKAALTDAEEDALITYVASGGAVGIFSIGLTRHVTSGRLQRVGAYIGSKSPVSFKYEGVVFTLLYDWDRYLRIDTNSVYADSDDVQERGARAGGVARRVT